MKTITKGCFKKWTNEILQCVITGFEWQITPCSQQCFNSHTSVKKMRPHMKMLTGDYFTNEDKSLQSGGSPFCNICSDKTEPESLGHLILRCSG